VATLCNVLTTRAVLQSARHVHAVEDLALEGGQDDDSGWIILGAPGIDLGAFDQPGFPFLTFL